MPITIPENITAETYLTSHEAGALLQVNPSSINKWTKEGHIVAHQTPGKHRRIVARDLVAFLVAWKMPIPAKLAAAAAAPPPEPAAPSEAKPVAKRKGKKR